ncbi:MAG: RsfS/YbeB/iojap family protein, partial [Flavobacteriales bacterium]
MKNNTSPESEPNYLSDVVIHGMQEKKAERIVKIDLRDVENAVCDFFIICHGNSSTHVESITNSIEEQTLKVNEKPWHIE